MAASYRSSTSGGNFSTAGANITLPTGAAAGDYLLIYYAYYGNSGSGGTVDMSSNAGTIPVLVAEATFQGTDRFHGLRAVVLNSGDISTGSIFVHGSDSFSYTGSFYLVCIQGFTSTSLVASNRNTATGTTPSFSNGVTPVSSSGFLIMIASGDANTTASGYAIATTNPASWTEVVDTTHNTGASYITVEIAYSSNRASAAATGNSSITFGSSVTAGCMLISISDPVAGSVSPSVMDVTISVQAPTVGGGASVSPSNLGLTMSVVAPTAAADTDPWTRQTKHTSTWNRQSKN